MSQHKQQESTIDNAGIRAVSSLGLRYNAMSSLDLELPSFDF